MTRMVSIPVELFDAMVAYQTAVDERARVNTKWGEVCGEWLRGEYGEDITLGQLKDKHAELFDATMNADKSVSQQLTKLRMYIARTDWRTIHVEDSGR